MRIAFYAPLKPPDHPTPSGDRLMARLLMAALERGGHRVTLASSLRAFLPDPQDRAALARLGAQAGEERARLSAQWRQDGPPDLWLCYHPYYKSPDLIGPPLARAFALPWVSVEASLSSRRDAGLWGETQGMMREAVLAGAVNIGLTARDRSGLERLAPGARIAAMAPFLGIEALPPAAGLGGATLVSVAMMRAGDKMESFRALAATVGRLPCPDWRLAVAGDGPLRDEVRALFPRDRVDWRGALTSAQVAGLLAGGTVYLWPGCGEAYGMAYLEAQAAGLPVAAWAVAGVPEVVADGETGLLAPAGDVDALAGATARLLADPALRHRMGAAARRRIEAHHMLPAAAARLDTLLRRAVRKGATGAAAQ